MLVGGSQADSSEYQIAQILIRKNTKQGRSDPIKSDAKCMKMGNMGRETDRSKWISIKSM